MSKKQKTFGPQLEALKRLLPKAKTAEVISDFQIARIGWESDNVGWVVRVDGKVQYLTTSHGGYKLTSRESIEEELEAAEERLVSLKNALAVI